MDQALEDQIEVLTVAPQWVAYRRVTCASDKIGETITAPSVYPGIYDLAKKHGVHAGPPFARYIDFHDDQCVMNCGVPITGPIPSEGDIVVDLYTSCRMLSYTFRGPYSELGGAHEIALAYIDELGLKRGGPCWEIYDGPGDADGNATTHVCYAIEP